MVPPLPGAALPPRVEADSSTRERILAATAEVLGSNGMTKLSLSKVAAQAGVSRPTLYRWFGSKRELMDAFVLWERRFYERALADAHVGLPASERLDAALRVVVAYQRSYPGLRMVDIEPEHVIPEWARRCAPRTPPPPAAFGGGAVVRVAMSHYLVRSDDGEQFLAQLRHAAGLKGRPPSEP